MFQSVVMWNLSRPDEEMAESIERVEYRGYNPEKTNLTSQFANKITNGDIKPLAVGNIADKHCPTGRDLYYAKGSNKDYRRKGSKTWGRVAGIFSQRYLASLFTQYLNKRDVRNYARVAKRINDFSLLFRKEKNTQFQELNKLASKKYEDPRRLLRILEINGRMEIGTKMIHTILSSKGNHMNPIDLSVEYKNKKIEFSPNPVEIGISKTSTPDFLIEKFKTVGDIKTGVFFDDRYLLTCAGYALAYENWKKMDINWGIIYFLPTRVPIDYAKPVTYAQLYIFPIDDVLRGWFLEQRDRAYEIVSKDSPPDFPLDTRKCEGCKYENVCKDLGLDI